MIEEDMSGYQASDERSSYHEEQSVIHSEEEDRGNGDAEQRLNRDRRQSESEPYEEGGSRGPDRSLNGNECGSGIEPGDAGKEVDIVDIRWENGTRGAK